MRIKLLAAAATDSVVLRPWLPTVVTVAVSCALPVSILIGPPTV